MSGAGEDVQRQTAGRAARGMAAVVTLSHIAKRQSACSRDLKAAYDDSLAQRDVLVRWQDLKAVYCDLKAACDRALSWSG